MREEDVNRDSFIERLGGKRGVPNWNLLCETLGDPDIRPHLEAMLERTARIGRLLDFALMIDGSGFGTTLLRNWRGSKYSGKVQRKKKPTKMAFDGDVAEDAKKRKTLRNIFELAIDEKALLKKFRGYIKVHTAAGAVTGLIYAIAPSLNFGAGAGDSIHFTWLVEKAMSLRRFEAVIADKAYESARHFAFAAARKLLLFVLPREGDTLSKAEPEAKHLFDMMNLLRERYPEVYRRFYRMRSKIEAFFSAMKRVNGHVRSKIRNGDIDRMFALRHDPFPIADRWPDIIHAKHAEICRMVAVARVGDAHANEAILKAVAMNLRTLCRLEAKYGKFDLELDEPIRAVPRVSLPRSA